MAEKVIREEELSQAMGRRRFMEIGEQAYKRSKETQNPFEKVYHLDEAIEADDQTLYKEHRARLR